MGRDDLYITIPNLFRCPISLDLMESPVSLCTGVTYDRTSIQRWLDSGHDTCPSTMQLLPSKDLVPNHTLHRLIRIWSTSSSSTRPGSIPEPAFFSLSSHQALDLVTRLIDGPAPATCHLHDCFTKLLSFSTLSLENRRLLCSNGPFVDFLIRVVSSDPNPEVVTPGLRILHLIISPKSTAVMIGKTHPGFFKSLTRTLKTGRPDSRVAVTGLIQTISPDPESKKLIFNTNDSSILYELLQILKTYSDNPNPKPKPEPETTVTESVLATLVHVSSPRVNKTKLIRAGGVRIVTNTIRTVGPDSTLVESGLTLLEMVSGTPEGRAAITEDPNCIARVVIQKLMKGTSGANEHGVALIWSLCYLFRDEKAKEAVMKSNGGISKILLLMQSDCSGAVKRMCCDLLRIFRLNSSSSTNKQQQLSCLATYDSKTTHIMPC